MQARGVSTRFGLRLAGDRRDGVLFGLARRGDELDLLALAVADERLAGGRLVGDLVLQRVGLGGAHDGELRGLALGVNQGDGGADGDLQVGVAAGGDDGGDGENLANLVDAGLVVGLLLLGGVVLGVLGEVTEAAGLLDALDDLVVLLALAVRELLHQLLAAFGGELDLLGVVHVLLST